MTISIKVFCQRFAIMFVVGALNICSAPTLAFERLQSSKLELPSATDLELVAKVTKDAKTKALVLEWTLRNSSNRDLSIGNTTLLNDYVIEVTDRQNKPARLTDAGQKRFFVSRMLSRKPPIIFHPDDEITDRISLNEIYDLERNRVYVVAVKRRFGTVVVKSNLVRIKFSG